MEELILMFSDGIVEIVKEYPILATIITGLATSSALATFVVNLTPTPKDNNIVAKFYRVIEILAGVITPKAKEKTGDKPKE